jgi:HEAT repeat protein
VNCKDINYLLDAHAPEEMTRAQRDAVDQHLASCPSCSEDWANVREVAALPVPAMSAGLHARIAAGLPAQVVAPRRAFRPFLVGGLLLAGAALAAGIALQSARHNAETLPGIADSSAETAAPPEHSAPENQLSAAPASAAVKVANTAAVDVPLDPHSIVVLMRPEVAADAPAVAMLVRCQDAIISQLRAVKGLNVLAGSAVSPYEAGRPLRLDPSPAARFSMQKSDGEIARQLGAGHALIIRNENGCAATEYNSQTGFTIAGLMYGGADPQREDWNSFAGSLAEMVRDKTLKDRITVFQEARTRLLDKSLSDRERAFALDNKPDGLSPGDKDAFRSFFDKELIAAAVQLGTKSSDAGAREAIWAGLRHVGDPALLQPLLHTLAADPEAGVRYQAALDLYAFLGQAGVREALQRAVTEDPAPEPQAACCIMTVREAAQRSLIADKDLRGWVRSTLLDESLPTRSRLLSLQGGTPDGRLMVTIAAYGSQEARIVFDIGRREQNPRVRSMAWNTLSDAAPDEAFFPVLLGDLASYPDEWVREAAARVLEKSADKPEVRAAFERALDDPSINVRSVATRALAGPGK